MAGALDMEDPATRSMLLDLFTDIAVLEHLVRERFKPLSPDTDARQFGIINYFMRMGKTHEKLSVLAWNFQVDGAVMLASVEGLAGFKYVEIDWVDGERCVFLTDAGRARHARFVDEVSPDVTEIVSEIDAQALRTTAETLRELRRTFDNLPDR